MRHIYISGKITGLDMKEAMANFDKASESVENYFKNKGEKVVIVNMMNTPHIKMSWADFMIRDLMHLRYCDTIALLPNHSDSHGSNIELEFAKATNMKLITLDENYAVVSEKPISE